MMTEKKRKYLVLLLRAMSVFSFLGVPAWVISTKFPLWKTQGGSAGALGIGAILILVIAFMTFKKYVVAFAAEKLGTMSAGVSLIVLWTGLAVVCIAIANITTILEDLSTVFVWSAIGAVLGVSFQAAARKVSGKKEDTDGKDA